MPGTNFLYFIASLQMDSSPDSLEPEPKLAYCALNRSGR
jgi:hypothetical protein